MFLFCKQFSFASVPYALQIYRSFYLKTAPSPVKEAAVELVDDEIVIDFQPAVGVKDHYTVQVVNSSRVGEGIVVDLHKVAET